MAKVPNATEILPKISTAWVGRTSVTDRQTTDRQTVGRQQIANVLLGEEAVASPSTGNTLWSVWTVFMRSAITPPEVNQFRWNLALSEYIVCHWPWQILGPIHTEARVRAEVLFFFCLVNNIRLYQYPVGQICTQDVDLRGGKSFWNKILKIFPQEVVFSKMASLWIISPTTSDCRRPELSNDIYIDENSRLHDPSTECPLSNLTVGINSKSFPWPVQRARGVHFWIRDQAWFTYF